MELKYDRGILLTHENKKLYLDPEYASFPVGIPAVVTHAHSDHTSAVTNQCQTFLTEQTLELFKSSQERKIPKKYFAKEFYEPFEIGPFEVSFIKAGHLLGASQVVVRAGNESIHFSGDFCPEPLLTVEGADTPSDIDISILDATYGDPKILFNPRENTRQELFIWILSQIQTEKIPCINVAHLGGAQEIIRLLNKLSKNLLIYVHPKIAKVCKVYSSYNVDINYQILEIDEITKLSSNSVVLLPRNLKRGKYIRAIEKNLAGKSSKAIVTGQTLKFGYSSFDFAAALSTHASFDEVIKVAKIIDPSKVYTYYGFSEELANSIAQICKIPSSSLQSCTGEIVSELIERRYKKHQSDPFADWYETID